MGFVHVQGGTAHTGSGADILTLTLGSLPAVGNLICVSIFCSGDFSLNSLLDGNNNSISISPSSPSPYISGTYGGKLWLAYMLSEPSPASTKITASFSGTSTYIVISADEFHLTGVSAVFGDDASSTGTMSNVSLPVIPVSHGGSLLYSSCLASSSIVVTSMGPWVENNAKPYSNLVTSYDLSSIKNSPLACSNSSSAYTSIGMSITGVVSGGENITKLTGYGVGGIQSGQSTSKIIGYGVGIAPTGIDIAKLTGYAVLGLVDIPTVTSLTSSQNPSLLGKLVEFTINISSILGIPTGNVILSDSLGSFPPQILLLSNGNASYSTDSMSKDIHSITASYGGDSTYSPSSSSISQIVSNRYVPDIILASSNDPQFYGAPFTLTASVIPPFGVSEIPTGNITLTDSVLGMFASGTLDGNGQFMWTMNPLYPWQPGTHYVYAYYAAAPIPGPPVIPTFVQSQGNGESVVNALSAQFTSEDVGGNAILVAIGQYSQQGVPVFTVHDSEGNAYIQVGTTSTDIPGQGNLALFAAYNINGGTENIVTVNSTVNNDLCIAIHEYNGLSGTVDGFSKGNAFTPPYGISSGSVTTTVPDMLFSSAFNQTYSDTLSPSLGWTDRINQTNPGQETLGTADQYAGSTGTYSCVWTLANHSFDTTAVAAGFQTGSSSFDYSNGPSNILAQLILKYGNVLYDFPGFAFIALQSSQGDGVTPPWAVFSAIPPSVAPEGALSIVWSGVNIVSVRILGNNGTDSIDTGVLLSSGSGTYMISHGFHDTITLTCLAFDVNNNAITSQALTVTVM